MACGLMRYNTGGISCAHLSTNSKVNPKLSLFLSAIAALERAWHMYNLEISHVPECTLKCCLRRLWLHPECSSFMETSSRCLRRCGLFYQRRCKNISGRTLRTLAAYELSPRRKSLASSSKCLEIRASSEVSAVLLPDSICEGNHSIISFLTIIKTIP